MPGTSEHASWPAVTCLCPTYGRFERLQDAVACFLLQDYPGPKELVILNDAAEPVILCPRLTITADQYLVDAHARVINVRDRFANLGAKRQALLEAARTPLVAHWDDDDLYLPWHLTAAVAALGVAGVAQPPPAVVPFGCSKSRCGWWALGRRECWELQGGVHHNTFEGQMVFRRDRALELTARRRPDLIAAARTALQAGDPARAKTLLERAKQADKQFQNQTEISTYQARVDAAQPK